MRKLRWGLIGGGGGSQIGPVHRLAARLDGHFELEAGAFDLDPEAGRRFGLNLGLSAQRVYGDWREMLVAEREREDRLDLVTIATPNKTHFEIAAALLKAGFDVFCEKPMTVTTDEAEEIVRLSRQGGRICAVNYGYSGYPMVREMRAIVQAGALGRIRLVKTEFAHGHHADAADAQNPRARWRYDPAQAGVSAQFADCGIHALHLASFVTGEEIERLSADCVACIESRQLEDDAMVNFRMSGGIVGRLWTSSIAIGHQHGLQIEIFGEKGGMRWQQEAPNQIRHTPLGGRVQIIERGEPGLSDDAKQASRVTMGHTEGMVEAFANLYVDLASAIRARRAGQEHEPSPSLLPQAEDGLRSVAAIEAVARSGRENGSWSPVIFSLFGSGVEDHRG